MIFEEYYYFRELNNKNILITGGTGFLGLWLLRILSTLTILKKDIVFKITILTRNKDKTFDFINDNNLYFNKINIMESDIRNAQNDNRFDYVIHAANDNTPKFVQNTELCVDTIINGTINILRSLKETQKIVYLSSGAVYGDAKPASEDGFIEEQKSIFDLSQNYSNYGLNKSIAEKLIVNSSINFSILRCFSLIGPGMDLSGHFAFANMVKSALDLEDINLKSNGNSIRNYIHPIDMAFIIIKSLFIKDNYICNTGSENISILGLAKKVAAITNQKINIGKELDIKRLKYIPNLNKFNKMNFHQTLKIEEMVSRTLKYYDN
jgi:dTDP-glucose 4,6-dehydratase